MKTVKQITDKSLWENFLSTHPEANFLQSWQWGEFHLKLGKTINRSGFFEDEQLIGVMLSVVEDARRGRYLTIPGGPIIDWHDTELVSIFTDHSRSLGENLHCVFVRVRPQLLSDNFSNQLFKTHGLQLAPMHLHAELTNQIDLTKSEPDILASMRKSTRYEIKKAQNLNIKVSTSTNPNDIDKFYDLQLETAKRQNFVPFSLNFLKTQFTAFAKYNLAFLYSAHFDNQLLAQAFIIFYGSEAVYHYGASTNLGRKYPGAYLIQWRAVQEAKMRGLTKYNLWGVAPEGETNHRFSSISLFKRGFGGTDVSYLPAHDLVISPIRYLFNNTIEQLRKIHRHL